MDIQNIRLTISTRRTQSPFRHAVVRNNTEIYRSKKKKNQAENTLLVCCYIRIELLRLSEGCLVGVGVIRFG